MARTPEGADRFAHLSSELVRALPPQHVGFLRELQLHHVEGDYLFVHAGIRPGVPLEDQQTEDLLYIRDDFLNYSDPHGHIVVHGHTITSGPDVRPNRIGIDTGAFATGRLDLSCPRRYGAPIPADLRSPEKSGAENPDDAEDRAGTIGWAKLLAGTSPEDTDRPSLVAWANRLADLLSPALADHLLGAGLVDRATARADFIANSCWKRRSVLCA